MRIKLLATSLLFCSSAWAQLPSSNYVQVVPQPVIQYPILGGVTNQVVAPVGNPLSQNVPANPYGTGYSVVTTERVGPDYVRQYMGDHDAVVHTTTTRIVPNNALGQPMPVSLFNLVP